MKLVVMGVVAIVAVAMVATAIKNEDKVQEKGLVTDTQATVKHSRMVVGADGLVTDAQTAQVAATVDKIGCDVCAGKGKDKQEKEYVGLCEQGKDEHCGCPNGQVKCAGICYPTPVYKVSGLCYAKPVYACRSMHYTEAVEECGEKGCCLKDTTEPATRTEKQHLSILAARNAEAAAAAVNEPKAASKAAKKTPKAAKKTPKVALEKKTQSLSEWQAPCSSVHRMNCHMIPDTFSTHDTDYAKKYKIPQHEWWDRFQTVQQKEAHQAQRYGW